MRERELKLVPRGGRVETCLSLPMRERELKLVSLCVALGTPGRSPCGSVN